jgi:zinc protease
VSAGEPQVLEHLRPFAVAKRRGWSLVLLALVACTPRPAVTVPAPATSPAAEVTPPPAPEKPMPPPVVTQTAQPQQLAFPQEEFRAHQPSAASPRPFRLPKVQAFALPNGIQVYLVEQHALPIVSIDLNFDGGSIVEPKHKDGLANVCMAMLTEGTDKLDKLAYAEALADIASSINAYATDDTQGVALSTLTKHLDATFALFADTIRAPGFRQSDFDRMIKRRIEAVNQARGTPSSIPGRVTGAIMYGADHPLGGIVTESSLATITLADCQQQVATWLQPKHARLFVVGDLTEAQVRALFEKSSLGATWTGAAPAMPRLPAPRTMAGRIFFVNVPNAAQSTVMLLEIGPQRTAPDYFANTMMSSVFGGSFTSRINMNLREDKGYSYGSRGGFSYGPKAFGMFTVTAPVQADSTYQTVLEVAKELKALASGSAPVTGEELTREKTNATLALPGRFATAQAALGQYRNLVYFGLPLDYYDTYVDRIAAVTEAQVKAAAAKHLHADQMVYVIVGDGDAKMIVHNPDAKKDDPVEVRRPPLQRDGAQLTLRAALELLATTKSEVGAGGLVELDVDGKPLASR